MKQKTKEQLLAEIKKIESDPNNLEKPGGLYIYKKPARNKLDKLRMEVASIIRLERIARGEYVNDAGYSGRQSNRR